MSLRHSFRKWFPSRQTPVKKRRTSRSRNKPRLQLEYLEDRITPASISDTGAGGTLTFVLSPGETVSVVSNLTTYGFTTNGANTFTNAGVSTTADFSAFGANSITWKSTAAITNFANLNFNDNAGANAG